MAHLQAPVLNICFVLEKCDHKSIVLLLLLSYFLANVNGVCRNESCLNGDCVSNECECSPGWKGNNCNFCAGRLRLSSSEGVISDGPGNYTENNQCSWLIEADDRTVIRPNITAAHRSKMIFLHIDHFATECSWDHLYIYDGDSIYAPLVAVYSGLVVSNGYKSTEYPEVVTTSGFALIHFYSDAAYNLTGFQIRYRIGGCSGGYNSKTSEWLECSGRGVCQNGECQCESGWTGHACQKLQCPHHCSNNGKCHQELRVCVCYKSFYGDDCSRSLNGPHWEAGLYAPYSGENIKYQYRHSHRHTRREVLRHSKNSLIASPESEEKFYSKIKDEETIFAVKRKKRQHKKNKRKHNFRNKRMRRSLHIEAIKNKQKLQTNGQNNGVAPSIYDDNSPSIQYKTELIKIAHPHEFDKNLMYSLPIPSNNNSLPSDNNRGQSPNLQFPKNILLKYSNTNNNENMLLKIKNKKDQHRNDYLPLNEPNLQRSRFLPYDLLHEYNLLSNKEFTNPALYSYLFQHFHNKGSFPLLSNISPLYHHNHNVGLFSKRLLHNDDAHSIDIEDSYHSTPTISNSVEMQNSFSRPKRSPHNMHWEDLQSSSLFNGEDDSTVAGGTLEHPMLERASFGTVVVKENVWIIGGYSFSELPFLLRYNFTGGRVSSVETSGNSRKPNARHGHTVVAFNSSIYMYGGMFSSGVVTQELWQLSLKNSRWRLLGKTRTRDDILSANKIKKSNHHERRHSNDPPLASADTHENKFSSDHDWLMSDHRAHIFRNPYDELLDKKLNSENKSIENHEKDTLNSREWKRSATAGDTSNSWLESRASHEKESYGTFPPDSPNYNDFSFLYHRLGVDENGGNSDDAHSTLLNPSENLRFGKSADDLNSNLNLQEDESLGLLYADSPNNINSNIADSGRFHNGEDCKNKNGLCAPIGIVGAAATLYPPEDAAEMDEEPVMLIIFGYSPIYGYLNTVQEYHFSSNTWRIVECSGAVVAGRYGHTITWDSVSKVILVHGGLVASSTSSTVVNQLLAYNHRTKVWYILPPSPTSVYLHGSVSLSEGSVVMFGGNSHNDTSVSHSSRCYSHNTWLFDTVCGSWVKLSQPIPKDLGVDVARYGHSMIVTKSQSSDHNVVRVIGGFNGKMLSSSLILHPGVCSVHATPRDCLAAYPAIKCVWHKVLSKCVEYSSSTSHMAHFHLCEHELLYSVQQPKVNNQFPLHQGTATLCQQVTGGCISCLHSSFGCVWCGSSCQYNQCSNGSPVKVASECRQESHLPLQCQVINSCQHCHHLMLHRHSPTFSCVWLTNNFCAYDNSSAVVSVSTPDSNGNSSTVIMEGSSETTRSNSWHSLSTGMRHQNKIRMCRAPCHHITSCGNCTVGHCMWCLSEQRCVSNNSYLVSFPFGSCREWVTSPRSCYAIKKGDDPCGQQRTCLLCHNDVGCGWCDDGSGTGTGTCIAGGDTGPRHHASGKPTPSLCPANRWYYTKCPECNCNGHSYCIQAEDVASAGHDTLTQSALQPSLPQCVAPCGNHTEGSNCQFCKATFYGNALNGGVCKPCQCNNHGTHCDRNTGRCYCSTKGVTGDHCQECDTQNNYFGHPLNGSCFYDLQIDYQFTFNLSKAEDKYVRQINFFNVPTKSNVDTDFEISSSKPARIKVSAKHTNGHEVWVVRNFTGTRFKKLFSHTDYTFGTSDNNTTFYVYVYNFTPPVEIVVSFSQYMKLNLLGFFYIFLLCFLCLLVIAALVWKIKQRYDMYTRRQRLMEEMEAMASRPFKPIILELLPTNSAKYEMNSTLSPSSVNYCDANGVAEGADKVSISKDSEFNQVSLSSSYAASPIALELCSGGKAAVLSLLVQLPTGGKSYMPYMHPGGLSIASTLVTLGSQQKSSGFVHSSSGDKFSHYIHSTQQNGSVQSAKPVSEQRPIVAPSSSTAAVQAQQNSIHHRRSYAPVHYTSNNNILGLSNNFTNSQIEAFDQSVVLPTAEDKGYETCVQTNSVNCDNSSQENVKYN